MTGTLQADGCGCLSVGGGARIPKREDARIANMLQSCGVHLDPSRGIGERTRADGIMAGLRRHDMDHVKTPGDFHRLPIIASGGENGGFGRPIDRDQVVPIGDVDAVC